MHTVSEMLKVNLLSYNYNMHPLVGPLNSIFSLGVFLTSTMGNLIRQETISKSYPKCPAAIQKQRVQDNSLVKKDLKEPGLP